MGRYDYQKMRTLKKFLDQGLANLSFRDQRGERLDSMPESLW